jgi:glucosamine--fructose-6-phosphate aminotransferase (isomerizing)
LRSHGRRSDLSSRYRACLKSTAVFSTLHEAAAHGPANLTLINYFIGGIRHGLACEANLNEGDDPDSRQVVPLHRFTPWTDSMVNSETVVVGLLSEVNRTYEFAVLNEMKELGATILTLAEADADIPFESGVPESARAVLYLPCLQLMAFHRSVAKGLNPDRPRYLAAAVHLDL